MSKWFATSAALWAVFVFIQTGSHREYFIPVLGAENPDEHTEPPTIRVAWISFAILVLALVTSLGDHKPPKPAGKGASNGVPTTANQLPAGSG